MDKGEGVLPIDNMTAAVGLKAKHDIAIQNILCGGHRFRAGWLHCRAHRIDRADRNTAESAGAGAFFADLR
jgi:hypothetical protein